MTHHVLADEAEDRVGDSPALRGGDLAASSRLGLADIMGHARNLPPAAALCVTDEAFARPLVGEGSLGVDLVGLLGGASSAHSP